MSEHTPGPWRASSHRFDRYSAMWHALEEPISRGTLTFWTIDGTPDETGPVFAAWAGNGPNAEANARLIAAAPELLATLKDVLAHIRSITLDPGDEEEDAPALVAAEALVAKAEGREP